MAVEAREKKCLFNNGFNWSIGDHNETESVRAYNTEHVEIYSVNEQAPFRDKKSKSESSGDSNNLSVPSESTIKNEIDVLISTSTSELHIESDSLNVSKKSLLDKIILGSEKTQEKNILVNNVINGILSNSDSSSESDVPLKWLKIGKNPITFDSQIKENEKKLHLVSSFEEPPNFLKTNSNEDEAIKPIQRSCIDEKSHDLDCIVTDEIFDVCIISDSRNTSDSKVCHSSKNMLKTVKQTVSGIKRHNKSKEDKPTKILKKEPPETKISSPSKKNKNNILKDKVKVSKCLKPSVETKDKVKESKSTKTSAVCKVKKLKCTEPSSVSKDKIKQEKCNKPSIVAKVKKLKCTGPSIVSKDKVKKLKCTEPPNVSEIKVKELKFRKPTVVSKVKVKDLKSSSLSAVEEQIIKKELNFKCSENICDKKLDVPAEQKVHIIHVQPEYSTENCQNSKAILDGKLYFETFNQQLSCICINSQITFSPEKSTSIIVKFKSEGICFELPKYKASSQFYLILLTKSDVERVLVYCDKHSTCFVSIITSSTFGEDMKEQLKTCNRKSLFYNPDTETTKQLKLSFLLQNVTYDIIKFLCDVYGEKKIRKINSESAFKMLKSPSPKNNVPQLLASNIFVYPSVGGIQIKTEDIGCLAYKKCLNDTIIEFYLKYIYHEKISPYLQSKTHMFSPFFYQGLERVLGATVSEEKELKTIESINKWTKNVDIFSKDFIFIPINKRRHWFLAVICYLPKLCKLFTQEIILDSDTVKEGESHQSSKMESETRKTRKKNDHLPEKNKPCICFFDSSDTSFHLNKEKSAVGTVLKYFLKITWESKYPDNTCDWNELLILKACCPQQKNTFDCGIYLLQYVESFFEKPISCFQAPLPDLRNWFSQDMIAHKRSKIKTLISELKEKYTAVSLKSSENCSTSIVECS